MKFDLSIFSHFIIFYGVVGFHCKKNFCKFPLSTVLHAENSYNGLAWGEGIKQDHPLTKMISFMNSLSSMANFNRQIIDKYLVNVVQSNIYYEHIYECEKFIVKYGQVSKVDEKNLQDSADFNIVEDFILDISKSWVAAMIADFNVCPFTMNADFAGIPRAPIRYKISSATNLLTAIKDYWYEISLLHKFSPSEIVTVLLVFPFVPEFDSYTIFEEYGTCLDNAAANLFENQIDNVYFHPEFKFVDKDGQIFFLFDDEGNVVGSTEDIIAPVSYARRSPWPIVNILRSPMVKQAQKGFPQGKVFSQNEMRLNEVGVEKLQQMLENKDWSTLPKHKSQIS